MGESERTEAERDAALARLAAARERGESRAEVSELLELIAIYRSLREPVKLVECAYEAWQVADRNCYWDLQARLALVFGDITYAAQQYQQSYDHYANACAYAMSAGGEGLSAITARIDQVLDEMLANGLAKIAEAFCELLVEYEADGGLGEPAPAFAEHFRERQARAKARVRDELARAIRLN